MLGHLNLLPPPDLSQTLPHRLRHQVVPLIIITWGILILIFNEEIVLLEGQSLVCRGLGAKLAMRVASEGYQGTIVEEEDGAGGAALISRS